MPKPKSKREPVKPINTIRCIECNLDFDLQRDGMDPFKQHLREVHQLTDLKGKRSMRMHMDGDTWYSWDWEWELGGKKFAQHTVSPRSSADQAFWNATSDE